MGGTMNAQSPLRRADPPNARVLSVGVILAHNFTLSAASLFLDHLRLAGDEGDLSRQIRCHWSILSNKGKPVRASCGVTLTPNGGLTDPTQFDYIAVVGGLLHTGPQIDDDTIAYLKSASQAGVPLIGICTGSFVLARAGLMTGRRCCVSWYHYQDFVDEFPHHSPVADRMFVVDGDRITCSGGGGSADLATFLIERHLGRGVAQKARHVLLLDHARGGNEAQPHPPLSDDLGQAISDPRIRRALLLMEQHLADPLPIAEIADRLRQSTRQLERLFHSVTGARPSAVYRVLRLRYAQWLLDNTDRSVTDIALEAGFSDCAHFSRQYKAMLGINPTDARNETKRLDATHPIFRPNPQELAGVRLFK